jgi:hypothetical protein
MLKLDDPVPAEASLTMYEPKGSDTFKRIEVYSGSETWGVEEDDAKYWLDRMRMFIRDERTWVFRNGQIWDGVTIRLGDKYWVEGSLPDPPIHPRPFSDVIRHGGSVRNDGGSEKVFPFRKEEGRSRQNSYPVKGCS